MTQFKEAEGSMVSMTDSAGALSTAYGTYMETTQAHVDQLKASFTDLSMTIFDSESTKDVIDFLNSVVQSVNEIIQHIGLLSATIAGAGIYKAIKKISFVYKELNMAGALSDLTRLQKITKSLQAAFPMLANVIDGVKLSMEAGFGATNTLKIALSGLWDIIKAHPVIAAITAIVALAAAIDNAKKSAAQAAEEAARKITEEVNANKQEIASLDELVSKYKKLAESDRGDVSNREEIAEIQKEITSLVGSQADNLDLVNGKLDEELKKINQIYKTQNENSTYSYRRALSSKIEEYSNADRRIKDDRGFLLNGLDNITLSPTDEDMAISSWRNLLERLNINGLSIDYNDTLVLPDNMEQAAKGLRDVIDAINEYEDAVNSGDWEKARKISGNSIDSIFDTEKAKGYFSDVLVEVENAIKGAEGATQDLVGNLLNTYYYSQGKKDISEIENLDDYVNYRQKIIDNLLNDKDIKAAVEQGLISEDYIQSTVDGFLAGLPEISKYYNQWFDDFGSEAARKAIEIKEKLSNDMYFFDPEEQFNGGQEKINQWFDGLTKEDKEILVKIDADTDTADWKLADWQTHLEEYKKQMGETVDETNNKFAQLMTETGTAKDPSFVEKTEKSIEKLQKLQDALTKVESGTLKDSERISLFKTFPQLTAYADNLAEGIKHVTDSMRSDIVSSFNEQIAKFNEQGASEEEIAQLNAYKDTVLGIADAVVTTQNALSSMQTVFQDLDKIVKDYNENQYFSLESLEKLSTSSGQKYLQYLTYENGQLKVNEEAYKKLVLAQIDEIETKATLQATTDLQSLSDETTAKEYLAKVNIDLADSQLTAAQAAFQYALALKLSEGGNVAKAAQKVADNLNTLRNIFASAREQAKSYSGAMLGAATATDKKAKASEKAKDALEKEQKALERTKESLENEKKALEKNKSEYEKAKNAIQDLIEWTQKYIKQIKENEIKALEEQKDKFDEIIEKRKEQLQAEKDLHEYEKSLSEKQSTLASNALKAAVASLDDSAAGKKAYKKAQEEYKTSQTDLQDFLYEHEIDVRQESLDKLKEDTDKSYQDQIDTIQDFLNDEVKMYREACSMIDNDNGSLYGKLLDYCLNYTTTGRAEFDHMWTTAKTAMETYNTANLSTLDLMNDLQGRIYDIDNAIDSLTLNIESYESRISNLKNQIDDLKDAAIEAQNALNMTNTKPLGGTSFWVNYNGKKYQTGNTYNGDTEANRLLAANELTKLIAKDVSGFNSYGLGIVQGLLGVGGNKTGHNWTYRWDGKTYTSHAATKDLAVADIRSQLAKKYGNSSFILDQVYGKITGYADGTKAATGGVHIVDEEGLFSEFIPYQVGKGRYSFLPEGNPVFSKAMTNTMFDFASDPTKFVNGIRESSSNNIKGDITVVNHIYGDVDEQALKRLEKKEKDIVEKSKNEVIETILKGRKLR